MMYCTAGVQAGPAAGGGSSATRTPGTAEAEAVLTDLVRDERGALTRAPERRPAPRTDLPLPAPAPGAP